MILWPTCAQQKVSRVPLRVPCALTVLCTPLLSSAEPPDQAGHEHKKNQFNFLKRLSKQGLQHYFFISVFTKNYFGKILFYFIEVKLPYNIISVAGGSHSVTMTVLWPLQSLLIFHVCLQPYPACCQPVRNDMSSLMVLIQQVYLTISVPL